MSSPRRVRKLSGLGKMAGRKATSLTPSCATSRMCRLRTTSTPTFEREVAAPCPRRLWMDRDKDKVGYEINFNRHFYKYTPPRPLEEIDADLKKAEEKIMRLLREVTA